MKFILQNNLYCINCYSVEFERKCAECKEYITDDKFIEAMGKYYHCVQAVSWLDS